MATRPDPTQSFGNITRLDSLATNGEEEPSWISPDDCRLYLTHRPDVGSPTSLYVATRGK